jgi:hypothetical protein
MREATMTTSAAIAAIAAISVEERLALVLALERRGVPHAR